MINRISINLLVVYRESVNLIGYITRRLSADSLRQDSCSRDYIRDPLSNLNQPSPPLPSIVVNYNSERCCASFENQTLPYIFDQKWWNSMCEWGAREKECRPSDSREFLADSFFLFRNRCKALFDNKNKNSSKFLGHKNVLWNHFVIKQKRNYWNRRLVWVAIWLADRKTALSSNSMSWAKAKTRMTFSIIWCKSPIQARYWK